MNGFIYLASQSPRRRELLTQIGVPHRLLTPDPDEDAEALEAVLAGEDPLVYARRVTAAKLDAAVLRLGRRRDAPQAPILCADTTVALDQHLYGKPADAADASRMLRELAGGTHRVITALALQAGARRWDALSESTVTFAAMTASQIDAYVASGEPIGKAGSYAVQGGAARYIARIEGSYSGVMGLPLFETAQLLRAAGLGL